VEGEIIGSAAWERQTGEAERKEDLGYGLHSVLNWGWRLDRFIEFGELERVCAVLPQPILPCSHSKGRKNWLLTEVV